MRQLLNRNIDLDGRREGLGLRGGGLGYHMEAVSIWWSRNSEWESRHHSMVEIEY